MMEKFSLSLPLVVAPMGGGPTTPELVAAVGNAGALGSLAGAYLSPAELRAAIAKTRTLTSRPFAINLFAPCPAPKLEAVKVALAVEATRKYRRALGLADPVEVVPPFHQDFTQQLAIVLEEKPAVFSFIFGLVEPDVLRACRTRGILTMGTATTREEGMALVELGVDMVVAQGVEAGAHRGMFSSESEDPHLGTLALTRSLSRVVHVPVIAAGGMMDGSDIAAALRAGASGAMLGTAFLLCNEAGTVPAYREALRSRRKTRLTRAFSGRIARGLENEFLLEMELRAEAILPFPAQNAFTRDIRSAAARVGNPEMLSLWAGEGVTRARAMPAAKLVETLRVELATALASGG